MACVLTILIAWWQADDQIVFNMQMIITSTKTSGLNEIQYVQKYVPHLTLIYRIQMCHLLSIIETDYYDTCTNHSHCLVAGRRSNSV